MVAMPPIAGPGAPVGADRALVPARVRRALPVYATAALLAVLAVGLRVHGHTRASRLDRWVDTRLAVDGHPWHGLIYLMAQIGSAQISAVIALVLAGLCWWWRDRWSALLCVLAPAVNDALTEGVLKPVVGRTKVGAFAYPSGHAGRAIAVATVAILLAGASGPLGRRLPDARRQAVQLVAGAVGAGVGLAVVALGWHYATDAAAGALLATSVTLVLAVLIDLGRTR
jgi:membrane-associated phospholipid phosphatase